VAGSGFEIEATAQQQAITGFSQAAENAKSTMNALAQALQESLGQYKGAQATAFWQVHSTLNDQMATASQHLDTLSDLIDKTTKNYNSGDDAATQTYQSVANTAGQNSDLLNRLGGGLA
jgi:uncharacterized protein YukE